MLTREQFVTQLQSSLAVKQDLVSAGDDELQPRDVRFQLLCNSKERLEEAVKHARLFAYTSNRPIAEQSGPNGSARYSAYLWTKTATELSILMRHFAMMLAIADAFGCHYTGWEAKVVKNGDGAVAAKAEKMRPPYDGSRI
jgi:hypothetical protein